MSVNKITDIYERLIGCFSAEDVFGPLSAGTPYEMAAELREIRRDLMKEIDPEKFGLSSPEHFFADESRRIVENAFTEAEKKIENQTYDIFAYRKETKSGITVRTSSDTYHLVSLMAEGDIAFIYRGYCEGRPGRIIAKIAKDRADNILMDNEASIIERLRSKQSPQTEKHLSTMIDRFITAEGKIGIIFDQFNGFDLTDVHKEHPVLDQKDMVWMMNRSLSCIGYAHTMSVIHGCITPGHIMIRPSDHNARIVDWCFGALDPAVRNDGFKVYVEGFSPPEVEERKPPLPSSDIYSIGKCMIYLVGGDVMTGRMPEAVDDKIQRLLAYCTRESALERPQDAWSLRRQLVNTIENLWGERTFRPLRMPLLK